MLREAFEYLTTPCDPLARRLGYLGETVALGARYRRQSRAWAPHVAACRRFVTQAMERALQGEKTGGRAMVAGSGLLIELPLEELATRFDELVLVDILHARSVRRRVARLPNVRLVAMDVTGALVPLAAALDAGRALPTDFTPPPAPGGRFAFAVSCNLFSQLPLMPLEAVERRVPALPDADRLAFAQRLARDHLEWLAGAADSAALFTDTENLWLRGGAVLEREDSAWGLALPAPDVSWLWDIAPAPEQHRRNDLRHSVGAWFDVRTVTSALSFC
ncbi:hypothetical protein [Azospirillum doebereinerae]|uniref:Class I SAM-dependent methyltransferase n=1 Tax=Azospirillum doebereinerae TaxID=92933 RepID=A0A433JAR8_9PROT|nr:hypothetical protein [Azospirillum doebereinerae]RUQ72934.1 hypothetical protein EJ913_10265 [Azospirillum doebereinerae]